MAFAGNSRAKGSLYWVIREDALYRLRASALALACVVSRSKSKLETSWLARRRNFSTLRRHPDEPTAAAPASPSTEETMSQQLGARGNDRDQHQLLECLRCN